MASFLDKNMTTPGGGPADASGVRGGLAEFFSGMPKGNLTKPSNSFFAQQLQQYLNQPAAQAGAVGSSVFNPAQFAGSAGVNPFSAMNAATMFAPAAMQSSMPNVGPVTQFAGAQAGMSGGAPQMGGVDVARAGIAQPGGTQSFLDLTGSPFEKGVLDPFKAMFAQQRGEALAQAKESAGNLTGSGFANQLGNTLNRSLAADNASLGQLGQQFIGNEVNRQLAERGQNSSMATAQGGLNASTNALMAQLAQQRGQFNAGNQSQFDLANAGFAQQAGLANSGAANSLQQLLASLGTQNSQFNAGQANQTGQFNAGLGTQGNQFNAGQSNALAQFLAGMQQQNNQFNSGQQNNMNQFNSGADLQNSQFNNQLGAQNNQFNAGQSNQMNAGNQNAFMGLLNSFANTGVAGPQNYVQQGWGAPVIQGIGTVVGALGGGGGKPVSTTPGQPGGPTTFNPGSGVDTPPPFTVANMQTGGGTPQMFGGSMPTLGATSPQTGGGTPESISFGGAMPTLSGVGPQTGGGFPGNAAQPQQANPVGMFAGGPQMTPTSGFGSQTQPASPFGNMNPQMLQQLMQMFGGMRG